MFETLTQGSPSTSPPSVTASHVACVTSSSPTPSRSMSRFSGSTRPSAAKRRSITSSVQTRSKGGSSAVKERTMWANMVSIVPTPTLSQASSVAMPVRSLKRRSAAGRLRNGHQSSW